MRTQTKITGFSCFIREKRNENNVIRNGNIGLRLMMTKLSKKRELERGRFGYGECHHVKTKACMIHEEAKEGNIVLYVTATYSMSFLLFHFTTHIHYNLRTCTFFFY